MRRAMLFLFLVACSGMPCPDGFVSSTLNDSRVCISALSYCVSDEQCSSAQFDCSRPCVHLPVNVLFSDEAGEKAATCNRSTIRCKQVPFVDNRCVNNQCTSTAHAADELIPHPSYQEVFSDQMMCYEQDGFDSILHLNVLNNFSIPLQQLEAYVNVSLRNGSELVAQIDLLNQTLEANESTPIALRLSNMTPRNIFIFAVRPVQGKGVLVGVRNNDAVASGVVPSCNNKPFK